MLYDTAMREVPPNRLVLVRVLLLAALAVTAQAAKTLDIYFIDVEGGQSTLIVPPSGQALLIDTGYAGNLATIVAQQMGAGRLGDRRSRGKHRNQSHGCPSHRRAIGSAS